MGLYQDCSNYDPWVKNGSYPGALVLYRHKVKILKNFLVGNHYLSLYSDADVIKMLEYLNDNIFLEFGGRIFQQIIGIPMGTNCAPLLADLFLYSYEAEFVQSLLKAGKKHLARQFNFTKDNYIDDVLSLKNTNLQSIWNSSIHVNLK